MTLSQLAAHQPALELLQRSLSRGRLGHAYLFTGGDLEELTAAGRALAMTLNCQSPPRRGESGLPLDACGECLACRKVKDEMHPDVFWVRPESKTRIIKAEQIRELIRELNLRPAEAAHKAALIVAADRMHTSAANAFLKTLEEPPAGTVLMLLSTEPQHLLETILSRCLRLNLAGGGPRLSREVETWLAGFAKLLAASGQSRLERYRLLGELAAQLNQIREAIAQRLEAQSPLQRFPDAEPDLKEQWEAELKAAIEAEYRRQRGELLQALEWWLRDVWLATQGMNGAAAALPALADATRQAAARLKPAQAQANLEVMEEMAARLRTNAQEALVLEVGLLKMNL
jgi:DNA polymerase-3 subunit delta'